MAYSEKYRFTFESNNGAEYVIQVLKDGYSGSVKYRKLGGAPVLKRQQNGPIHGSSLTFKAETSIDGEFAEFYTSNAREFKVRLFRRAVGDIQRQIWEGYISTEIYSEPSIAPPYDVEVTANDCLGELKNIDYEPVGLNPLAYAIYTILQNTGIDGGIYIASAIHSDSQSVLMFYATYRINLDFLNGKTCYEALTIILESLRANIFQYEGAWYIFREADYSSISGSIPVVMIGRGGNTSTSSLSASNLLKSIGKKGVADMWPEGFLSQSIYPAKKRVSVHAPWHISNALIDPDFRHSGTSSSWTYSGTYTATSSGLRMGNRTSTCEIKQTLTLKRLVTALKVSALFNKTSYTGGASGGVTYVGSLRFKLKATYTSNGSQVVKYGTQDGWVDEETWGEYHNAERYVYSGDETKKSRYNSITVEETFPSLADTPDYTGGGVSLELFVEGKAVLYTVSLTSIMGDGGYDEKINIQNGALGEAEEVEVFGGRLGLDDYYNSYKFLQGVFIEGSNYGDDGIAAFSDSAETDKDFLDLSALAYARQVALPRLLTSGILDVPADQAHLPIFVQNNVTSWIRTMAWDLQTDSLSFEAMSLPAVSITVESYTVTQMDGAAPSSTDSSGSTGSTPSGSTPSGTSPSGGTVTSVALQVPAELSVSGSPITTDGTIVISLGSGREIPLSTDINKGVTAYGWGNHANAGYAMQTDLEDLEQAVEDLGGDVGIPKWFFAPKIKLYNHGYENFSTLTAITPHFYISHPLLDKNVGAKAILMIYNKRRGRASAYQPPVHPKYSNAWGEAKGGIHSAIAPMASTKYFLLDDIRTWILHHYICSFQLTKAQVTAMSMTDFRDDYESSQGQPADFRFGALFSPSGMTAAQWKAATKESRMFGIAIRVPNPDFTKYANANPAETTREIQVTIDGHVVRIPRYFYTEVVPFRVHCHKCKKNKDGDFKYELGIEFGPPDIK